MTQPSPADELQAAAFQLRNPFHHPGLTVGIDTDVAHTLADLLDRQGRIAREVQDQLGAEFQDGALDQNIHDALAVARAITGSQP